MTLTQRQSTRVEAPTRNTRSTTVNLRHNFNDVMPPNPVGRGITDDTAKRVQRKPQKIIGCRESILVATQNVRTLRQQNKKDELFHLFTKTGLTMLGIVDHKIVHEEEIVHSKHDNNTLITTSAWRNDCNAAQGGVGIMINKTAADLLAEVVPVNKRTLIVHFNGNPKMSIIVTYAPIEGSNDSEEHYQMLTNVINSLPKHNFIVILGDFNAHLGKKDALFTFHNETNKNGELLKNLSTETNMAITNTAFKKRKGNYGLTFRK